MSDTKSTEAALELTPVDINISPEGRVEIINPQLAERIRAALKGEGREQRLKSDHWNAACGNNYKCGVAREGSSETADPVQIRIR